ncbi:MAG TPA: hypothetical protein VHG28_02850 [Longimicrobiaceae bacterium]|nr:hypothetical protein [Longimicrobiaceae bacterium]
MVDPNRPRDPAELAQAVVRLVGAHRVQKVIGLAPVSPPEGHAFYVFVILDGEADDALSLEAKLYDRFSPRRPRVDFWIMNAREWERSQQRIGHPARSAFLEGEVLYPRESGEAGISVA